MNKKHTVSSIWRVLLAIVAILMTSGISPIAVAADYTLGSTDGTWSSARTSGGSIPTCLKYSNTANTTDENAVAYGEVPDGHSYDCPRRIDLTKQSGFGFQGVQDVPFVPGATFALGEFTHYNNPIVADHIMNLVDLAISLNFTDPAISTTLNYTVQLDETPNSGGCTYPGSTTCPDKVDFTDTFADETFWVGGIEYTLQIVGFIPGTLSSYSSSATPINQFITEEDQENHAVLIGRIIVAEPSISLTKTVDDPVVYEGDSVSYSFTVLNDGDVDLKNVVLSDPLLNSISTRSGDVGNDGILSVGETWTYTGQLNSAPEDGFVNTATVSAKVVGSTTTVSDTDTAEFTVIHPDILVVKTADVDTVHEGDTVTYEFEVTNTGDVNLTSVDVTDPLPGLSAITLVDDGDGDAALSPAEVWIYEATLTAGSSDISNTATAEGYDTLGGRVSDTDSEFIEVISPDIELTKTVNPTTAQVGDEVTYTLVAENTGDTPLYNIQIDDDLAGVTLGAPVQTGGNSSDAIMQVGETWTWTGTLTITGSADVINTATVSGDDELDKTVDDEDGATVNVINPGIEIVKTADADTVHEGDTVTYEFEVTNTGDVNLTSVDVTDPLPGLSAITLVDDGDGDAALSPAEVWIYEATLTAGSSDISNTATAEGYDTLGGRVSDTDSAFVEVISPDIELTKTVNPTTAQVGDEVTYTLVAENTGDTPLYNIQIEDGLAGVTLGAPVESGTADSIMQVGETWTWTGTLIITGSADVVNTATVSGVDELEKMVDDEDGATVNVINPGLTIDKVADVSVIALGGTINYTITVTNNGDVTLTNVKVTDAKLEIDENVGSLAPQESKVVTGSYGPVTETDLIEGEGSIYNIASATSDQTKSVYDDVTVKIATEPGLAIDKTGPSTVVAGNSIEYIITVSNIGNVTLHNVVVTDTKLGLVATLPELAVGASQVLTGTYGPVSEADQPGPVHNVATADSDETGPVSDDHDVEIEQPFEPRAALEIVKTGDAVVNIGEMIDYEITVTNIGNVDLNNVVVTDAKLGLNQTIALLAIGDSETINASYGPVTEADGDQVINTAVADSDETDPEEDDWTTVVVSTPGLAITKTGPATAEVGDTIDYEITVMNTGDVTLHNVVVTDARLGYTETLAELAPGASVALTVSYGPVGEADLPGPIINTAVAEADEAGPVEDSWSVDLEVPYYAEPESCDRADVSVVIYGGWNDIAVRAWVGGTEQDMLYTETNADGEAQVMWTLYPPESGSWSVQVAPELPSGLDATRWEYRLVRVESPSEDWSTENPSSATVTVRRCNQYIFYYQLYDKGTTEEIVTPPVLPQTGNIDMATSVNNGLVLWLKVGFLGLLGMVGLISSRNKKETEK